MAFFDDFNRFFGTSQTGAAPARLNARYEALIARNAAALAGKRVLDIASHDGRWTFAALKSGAAHVVGIEARSDLVDHAKANLTHYGFDRSRFRFVCGDAFEGIRAAGLFDVVICAGFYYHVARHVELFDLMERTKAALIVLDTAVAPTIALQPEQIPATKAAYTGPIQQPHFIQLSIDRVELQSDAAQDTFTRNGRTIVGRPSREAIDFIAGHFGFSVRRFDWKSFIAARPEDAAALVDYDRGWRDTFFCQR